MQDNDHDLIMQFARGTEALTLFSELSALADHYDERKQAILRIYQTSLHNLYQDYYGKVDRAVRHTENRLRDLTTDDDGYHEAAEIED